MRTTSKGVRNSSAAISVIFPCCRLAKRGGKKEKKEEEEEKKERKGRGGERERGGRDLVCFED